MRELLRKKLAGLKSADEKYNSLREFLQEMVLHILDRHKYFRNLAFVGGTALRVIYDLPRFSEDLDFSLVNKKNFDFEEMLSALNRDLTLSGFEVEINKSSVRTVYSAFIKFKRLMHELGLSPHASEKIFVKLEIDSNPPTGYLTEISLINKNFLFKAGHYDPSSLFASKLHAFLFRKYAKGRDYYDLLWFLTRKTPINYNLLNSAAEQTQKEIYNLTPVKLKALLIDKIKSTNFKHIQQDLRPFLVNQHEIEYFTQENFTAAIEKAFK